MAVDRQQDQERLTTPELDPYIISNVVPTGRELGRGAYGSVEEVEIPGGVCAAKKLHDQLVQFGSELQVQSCVYKTVWHGGGNSGHYQAPDLNDKQLLT